MLKGGPIRLPSLALVVALTACVGEEGRSQDRLSAGWPQWQRIEASQPPTAWQVEEASFFFDAWEASAVVVELSTTGDATTIGLDDGAGGVLDVRIAALPSGSMAPVLAEGDVVHVSLIRRQGFEGIAQGLVLRSDDDQLLLLYDDGGYGAALSGEGVLGEVGVSRSLRGTRSGGDWESRDVTFEIGGASFNCAEGGSVRLGMTDLAVKVIVSREWTGEPVTDADLTPLAYLVVRTR